MHRNSNYCSSSLTAAIACLSLLLCSPASAQSPTTLAIGDTVRALVADTVSNGLRWMLVSGRVEHVTADSLIVRGKKTTTRVANLNITSVIKADGKRHPYLHDALVGFTAGVGVGFLRLGLGPHTRGCPDPFTRCNNHPWKTPLMYGIGGVPVGLIIASAGRARWIRAHLPEGR
jgi:hypothetical protein